MHELTSASHNNELPRLSHPGTSDYETPQFRNIPAYFEFAVSVARPPAPSVRRQARPAVLTALCIFRLGVAPGICPTTRLILAPSCAQSSAFVTTASENKLARHRSSISQDK
ncbi:hypothetical protein WJX74_006678 [Apatococcus lobatus]|uniref:Uncharacterized protein n=1 Tax=Apatococcus lobatus TaxID=904363 RepID=A0AAW1QLA0_9CHLO